MNAIVPFTFDDKSVRVTDQEGQPWFVLADACALLGIRNPSDAAGRLDDTEKARLNLGSGSDATIVSLAGLLTLMLRCRGAMKPGTVPYRVRKWVTAEVVPAIMRTGSYGRPAIDVDDNATLRALLLGRMDTIEALAPKAEAFDRIADARGNLTLTEAAKVLKLGRKELTTWLFRNGWTYRAPGNGRWMGYRAKEIAGVVEHRISRLPRTDGTERVVQSLLITPKGLAQLAERVGQA